MVEEHSDNPEDSGPEGNGNGASATTPSPKPPLGLEMGWNPVTILACGIVLSIIALIAAALLGLDRGKFVDRMSEPDFARGIIAYLFAVTTIGVAVIVVLSGMMGANSAQYTRGKDVLSLLLGVFGTVIGFYFGSAQLSDATVAALTVSPPLVAEGSARPGGTLTVTAFIQGGKAPYRYTIKAGDGQTSAEALVGPDGWLRASVQVPSSQSTSGPVTITIEVTDGAGTVVTSKSEVPMGP
jgi:hypothetical protein